MPPRQLLPRTQKRNRSSSRNLAKPKKVPKSVQSKLKVTCSKSKTTDDSANVEDGFASSRHDPYVLCLKNGGKLIIKAEVHSPPRFDLEDAGEQFEDENNSKAFGHMSEIYPKPAVVLHAAALSFLSGDDWPKAVSSAVRASSEDRDRRSGKCGDSGSDKNVLPVVLNEVCSKRSVENKTENHTVFPTETKDIIQNYDGWTPKLPGCKMAVDEDIFGEENSMLNHLPLLKSALSKISGVSSRNPPKNSIQVVSSSGKTPFERQTVRGKRKMVDEACTPAEENKNKDCSVDASTENIIKNKLPGEKDRSTVRKRHRVSSQKTDALSTRVSGDEESGIFSSLAEANIPGNDKVLDWMMSSVEHMRQDCQGFTSENEEGKDTNYPSVTPKAPSKKRRKFDSTKKFGSRNSNRDSEAIAPGPSVRLLKEVGHSDKSDRALLPISPMAHLFETGRKGIEVKFDGQNSNEMRKPMLSNSSIVRSNHVSTKNTDTTEIASFNCHVGPRKTIPQHSSNKLEVTGVDSKSAARPVTLEDKDKLEQLAKLGPVETLEQSIISRPELMLETEQNKAKSLETNLVEEKCSGSRDGNCSYRSETEDEGKKDITVVAPLTSGRKLKIVQNRTRDVANTKEEFVCVKDNFDNKRRVCKHQTDSSISIQTNEFNKQMYDHNPSSACNQAESVATATEISPPITDVFARKEKTRPKLQMKNKNAEAVAGSVMSHLSFSARPESGCDSLALISMAKSPRTEINQHRASMKILVSNNKSMKTLISPPLQAGLGTETNNSTKIPAINLVTSFYGRTNMETPTDDPSPTVSARKETHKSQEQGSLPTETENNESQCFQGRAVWFKKVQKHNKAVCNMHATQPTKEREITIGNCFLPDEVQSYSSSGECKIKLPKEKIGAASKQSSPSPHHQHLKTTQSPALTQSEPRKVRGEDIIDQEQDNSEENPPNVFQDDEQVEETVLERGVSSLSNMSNSKMYKTVTTSVAEGKVQHANYEDGLEDPNLQIEQPSLFTFKSNNVAKYSLFGDESMSPKRDVLPSSTVLRLRASHSSTHNNRVISSSRFPSIESIKNNKTQNSATEKRVLFTNWRDVGNAEIIDTRCNVSSTSVALRSDNHETLREVTMSFGLASSNATSKCVSFGGTFFKFNGYNTSLQECSSGSTNLDKEVPRFNSVPSTRKCSFNTGDRDFNDALSISNMSLDDETGKKPIPSTPIRPSKFCQLRCSYSNNSFSRTNQRQLDIPCAGNSHTTKSQCFTGQFGQLSGYCPPSQPVPTNKPTSNQDSAPLVDGPSEVIHRNGIEYQVITAKLLVPQYNPLQYLNQVPPQPLLLTARQQRAPGPGAWVKGVGRSLESFEHYDVHALG